MKKVGDCPLNKGQVEIVLPIQRWLVLFIIFLGMSTTSSYYDFLNCPFISFQCLFCLILFIWTNHHKLCFQFSSHSFSIHSFWTVILFILSHTPFKCPFTLDSTYFFFLLIYQLVTKVGRNMFLCTAIFTSFDKYS